MQADNNKNSIPIDEVQKFLSGKDGLLLLALLNKDGGAVMQKATQAAKAGDYEQVKQLLTPLLGAPEAAALLEKLSRGL